MGGFTVEPMRPEHVEAVCDIEQRSFSVPWPRNEIIRDFNENERAMYFVALDESGAVAGYACMWHVVNEGHINNIAVDEPFRGRGAGSALVEKLVEAGIKAQMIGLTLEARVGNRAALGLYNKYGFKIEGYRKNYYTDTKEDAVIMWKNL